MLDRIRGKSGKNNGIKWWVILGRGEGSLILNFNEFFKLNYFFYVKTTPKSLFFFSYFYFILFIYLFYLNLIFFSFKRIIF